MTLTAYDVVLCCAHVRTEDEFCHLHEAFLAKHCHHFEDCEENKHVYMDVFRSYVRAPSAHTVRARTHTPHSLSRHACRRTLLRSTLRASCCRGCPGSQWLPSSSPSSE